MDDEQVDEDLVAQDEVERLAGCMLPAKLEFCVVGSRRFHRIGPRLWAEYGPYPKPVSS